MSEEGEEGCGKDDPDGRYRKLSSNGADTEGKRLGRTHSTGSLNDLSST